MKVLKIQNEMLEVQNKVIAKITLTERENKLFMLHTSFGLITAAKKALKSGL